MLSVSDANYFELFKFIHDPVNCRGTVGFPANLKARRSVPPDAGDASQIVDATVPPRTVNSPKIPQALSDLYDEWARFRACGATGEFKPSQYGLLVAGDYVNLKAIPSKKATADELLTALTGLGLKDVVLSTNVIGGQFPITNIPSLPAIKELGTATPEYGVYFAQH